jgi:hypothetical protein
MVRFAPLALVAALTLTLHGCGGDGPPASPTTPSLPAAAVPGTQADPLRDAGRASGKLVGTAV